MFPAIVLIVGPDDVVLLETAIALLGTCFILWNSTSYGNNFLPI